VDPEKRPVRFNIKLLVCNEPTIPEVEGEGIVELLLLDIVAPTEDDEAVVDGGDDEDREDSVESWGEVGEWMEPLLRRRSTLVAPTAPEGLPSGFQGFHG